MRKRLTIFFFLFALFWLEIGFKKVFPGSFLIPQFVLLFVVIFAVGSDFKETLIMSMIGGFLGELYSGLYFGTVISSMCVAALIAYFMSRNVTAQALSLSSGVLLFALLSAFLPLWAFLYNLAASGLGLVSFPEFRSYYSWILLPQVLVNLAVFFPVNRIFKAIFDE